MNTLPIKSRQPVPTVVAFASNFEELTTAIFGAARGANINITVTASFPISGAITICHGKTVSINSNANGPFTLTRAITGHLFDVSMGGTLSLYNIIIDGNSTAYPDAGGPLIAAANSVALNIYNGAQLVNNHNGSGAGGVSTHGVPFFMYGGRIAQNRGTSGGGVSASNGSFLIDGGIIESNEALYDGGGVYCKSQDFSLYSGAILNNTAAANGGGVSMNNGTFHMLGRGEILNNSAALNGGGVYGGQSAVFSLTGGLIDGNTAQNGDGGGIYITNRIPCIEFSGDLAFANNSAPNGNGGAIGYLYDDTIASFIIMPSVVFANNSASAAYLPAASDIKLHNAHIFTASFTTPFTYAFNNYDIEYTRGTVTTIVTVSFEANGGSDTSSEALLLGSYATEPYNPTRAGYSFCGWYTDPGLTIPWSFSNPVITDVTLYACWNALAPGEHLITFISNGGSAVANQVVADGGLATEPATPTSDCYSFLGWYSNPELTMPWDFGTPVFADLVLYAGWLPGTCPAGYHCEAGRGCVPSLILVNCSHSSCDACTCNPCENIPCVCKPCAGNPCAGNPCTGNSCVGNPCANRPLCRRML